MRERIVVFMAGLNPREALYCLAEGPEDHEPVAASMSPVALIQLQKNSGIANYPDRVIALVTESVRTQAADQIEQAFVFEDHKIPVELVDIPDGENSDEIREMIERLLTSIPDECDLVIDVTHGFRGGPLVFLLAVQYLSLINPSVSVKEIYYGMYKKDDVSPIIDMSQSVDMLDWVYAMRVFRDTLIPTQLSTKIRLVARNEGHPDESLDLVHRLELFSAAVEAALPAEMAKTAIEFRDELAHGAVGPLERSIPLGTELFGALEEVASEFIPPDAQGIPSRLNDKELDRQALFIDKLIQHGRIVQAVGLMHEWCTLKVLRHNSPRLELWRDRKEQERADNLRRTGKWSDQQLRGQVEKTRQLRNALHHYAQRADNVLDLKNLYPTVKSIWTNIKSAAGHPKKWIIKDETSGSRDRPMHSLGDYIKRAGLR